MGVSACAHTGCEAMRASEETTHSRSPVKGAGSPRYGASYWTLSPYRMIHDDASQDIGASASALQLACRVPLQQRREPGWNQGGTREEPGRVPGNQPRRPGARPIPVGLALSYSLHQLRLHSPFATSGPQSPHRCGEQTAEIGGQQAEHGGRRNGHGRWTMGTNDPKREVPGT